MEYINNLGLTLYEQKRPTYAGLISNRACNDKLTVRRTTRLQIQADLPSRPLTMRQLACMEDVPLPSIQFTNLGLPDQLVVAEPW